MMDYERFKAEVLLLSSIDLNAYKEKQMKRRIDSLIKKNNYEGYEDYIKALRVNKALYNEFINYLTINVSEFYRNPDQWSILEKEVISVLLAKNRSLKIWSSACSTGDEPYTLVMVLNKYLPLSNIKIIATDIDKEIVDKAKRGIYHERSVEDLPSEFLNKHFTKTEDGFKINDDVKRCVEFSYLNLLKDQYPQNCDLIVCRNVLIYFTEEAKNEIYKKFNRALKHEGILFVGSTEQIILSQRYNFKAVKTFFYQKEKNILI